MDQSARKIRVALMGVGNPHTSARVQALRNHGGFELAGAADDAALLEPFVKAVGIEPRTADEIWSDPAVDAVMIHSATNLMAEYACRSMRAGKHVFLEKPGGRSAADLKTVCDVVDQTGLVCQVGYSFRYSPVTERLDRALESGSLGKVLQVRGHGAVSYGRAAKPPMNRPENMGGSVFIIGSHMLDLMIHHFGMPKSVNARIPKFGTLMGEGFREDAGVVIMNYADMIASFDFFSWDPLPWAESWEISVYGTEGIVHARPLPRSVKAYELATAERPGGWTEWTETSFPLSWTNEQAGWTQEHAEINNPDFYRQEMQAFANAIGSGSRSPIPASDAYDLCLLMEAIYRSSGLNGEEVVLGMSPSDPA